MPSAQLEKETKKPELKQKYYAAPIALFENAGAYIVFVQVPGVEESAIKIHLDKGILTIEAPMKVELPEGTVAKHFEMHLGDLKRTFDLNGQVDEQAIGAEYRWGLLKLTLPKNKSGRARQIAIQPA